MKLIMYKHTSYKFYFHRYRVLYVDVYVGL